MEREVDIAEFIELLRLAELFPAGDLLAGVILYNPSIEEEYSPFVIDNGVAKFTDLKGQSRSVPLAAMSQWSVVIPDGSLLNSSELQSRTISGRRQELISQINKLGLTSGQTQSLEDLQAILAGWQTPIFNTHLDFRRGVYRSIKKLENEPGLTSASYRLGSMIMERWLTQSLDASPPDYLIQLAYYRRWTKQTSSALEVTALIERRDAQNLFNKFEIAVLATERAAAFMDKYEKDGVGLDQAYRFLKYHHKLLDGKSDEHNVNAWKRYDALSERNKRLKRY
jgi:hypothetical protein